MTLDEEQPWTWRLNDVLGLLSDRQRRYVELLPRVFRVRTAAGRVRPYDMQPYQAWWHAHADLPLGSAAKSRIVEKGRGLGLTMMSAMDTLMLAHRSQGGITIPIAGRAGDTSDEFIEKTWHLLDDAHEADFFAPRRDVTSRVVLDNGSRIVPMPGGSPNKVRSKRIVKGVLDEYAFHEYATQLRQAMRGSLSEGGTLDIISTHNGADTEYYRLLEETRLGKLNMTRFYFPVADPKAWRQDVPVKDQVKAGLGLIAPWIGLEQFEEFRREDPTGCAQEMLCDVMDAALNLLSRAVVEKQTDPSLPDWGKVPAPGEVSDGVARQGFTIPRRPPGDKDPVSLGVDFAREGDLAAYTAWAATPEGPRQRWLDVLRSTDTPDQNQALRSIVAAVKPTDVFIDMTGNGTGLYDYAKKELPCEVHGVHFAAGVHMGGAKKTPIKKAIALNLARYLGDGEARLLGASRHTDLQRRHLLAVRRADLDAPSGVEGHADILWANALALWGVRHLDRSPLGQEPGPVDVSGLLTNTSF